MYWLVPILAGRLVIRPIAKVLANLPPDECYQRGYLHPNKARKRYYPKESGYDPPISSQTSYVHPENTLGNTRTP